MDTKEIAQLILDMPLVRGFDRYDYTLTEEFMMQQFFRTSYEPKTLEQEINDAEQEYGQLCRSRYVLFEFTFDAPWFPRKTDLGTYFPQLRREEIRNGQEIISLKHYLLRFTTPGGLSHLGIAGSFVHELNDTLRDYLKFGDVKLHQTNHNEPLCLAATEDFYLNVLGGGFFGINSKRKEIRFFGKSKTFKTLLPDAKELAIEEFGSPKAFNGFASGVMNKYLQEKEIGYQTTIRERLR